MIDQTFDPALAATELRREGDRLFDLGDYDGAAQLFERLDPLSGDSAWCDFQLGRIAVRQGRWPDAIALLTRSLNHGDTLEPWVHFERSQAHWHVEPEDGAWTRDLACFVGYDVHGLTEANYNFIAQAAHWAFDHHFLDDAFRLYRFLWFHEAGGFACFVRYADLLIRDQNYNEAITILQLIEFDPGYNHWGDFARGRAHQALGESETARFYFTRAALRLPTNPIFWQSLFVPPAPDLLPLDPLNGDVAKLIESLSRHAPTVAAENFYHLLATAIEECLDSALIATIEELTASGAETALYVLIDNFGGFEHGSGDIIAATLGGLARLRGWDNLSDEFARCRGNYKLSNHNQFWSKRLEFLCRTRQYDEARAHLTLRDDLSSLTILDTVLISVLYASFQQWDDLIDLIARRVTLGLPISNQLLLETLCRATRHTGRYTDVLVRLAEALINDSQPMVRITHDHLTEELHLRTQLDREHPIEDMTATAQFARRLQEERAHVLARLLHPYKSGERHMVYFCTDLNYLTGCCAALYSLLHNNIQIARQLDITIYCTHDAISLMESVSADFNSLFVTDIQIVSADSIVGQDDKLRNDYGCFTPGYSLADAAYYRIFAARDICNNRTAGRVLYVDADAIFSWGVNALLDEWPMAGQPLAAAPEIVIGEIREAAENLGIEPESYFNSGVLLFDLAHPELPNLLDHAIDLAINHSGRLFFQDQCALNLAFHRRAAGLPQKFNYFIRERDAVPRFLEEPTIWHFLDRPKPWDPLYRTPNCGRWLRELAGLGEIIGSERLKQLLLLQFPRA